MNKPEYYIVELTEDVNCSWNSRIYNKGVRVMVWEDSLTNAYWVINVRDNFLISCAKKLYEFTGKEI